MSKVEIVFPPYRKGKIKIQRGNQDIEILGASNELSKEDIIWNDAIDEFKRLNLGVGGWKEAK